MWLGAPNYALNFLPNFALTCAVNLAMWLWGFCVIRGCFVLLSRDNCNDRPAAVDH